MNPETGELYRAVIDALTNSLSADQTEAAAERVDALIERFDKPEQQRFIVMTTNKIRRDARK